MGLSCWWREATRALIVSYRHTPAATPLWPVQALRRACGAVRRLGKMARGLAGVRAGSSRVYDIARVIDETRKAIAPDALPSRRLLSPAEKGLGRARLTAKGF